MHEVWPRPRSSVGHGPQDAVDRRASSTIQRRRYMYSVTMAAACSAGSPVAFLSFRSASSSRSLGSSSSAGLHTHSALALGALTCAACVKTGCVLSCAQSILWMRGYETLVWRPLPVCASTSCACTRESALMTLAREPPRQACNNIACVHSGLKLPCARAVRLQILMCLWSGKLEVERHRMSTNGVIHAEKQQPAHRSPLEEPPAQ